MSNIAWQLAKARAAHREERALLAPDLAPGLLAAIDASGGVLTLGRIAALLDADPALLAELVDEYADEAADPAVTAAANRAVTCPCLKRYRDPTHPNCRA